MKKTAAALLFICLATGLLTSCQKYTLDKETTYTFSNGLNESVTLNIYQTKPDYNNATNVWKQLILPAHGQQTLTMEIGKKYYADWYNADGTYTNWMPTGSSNSGIATPLPELSIAAAPQTITLTEYYPTNARNLLLPNNSTSSRWRVIGQYNGSNQLDPAPYALVTFNKDFTSSIRYALTANDTTNIVGQYVNYNGSSQTDYLSLYITSANTGQSIGQCTYSPNYPYPPTSRDTFSCNLYFLGSSNSYLMVRQ